MNRSPRECDLEYFDHPSEWWESKNGRFTLYLEYSEWLTNLSDWSTFITLTFRNPIGYDPGLNKFKSLIQILNRDVFGKRYSRIVGHSYFSYILCPEYQQRDVLHFHALVYRPVNYQLIHDVWNNWAGFAQTKRIRNSNAAIRYANKYAIKDDDIYVYKTKRFYEPISYPKWWSNYPPE